MKKLVILTTSLCLLSVGTLGSLTAFAEEASEGLNTYPVSFTREVAFEDLQDYAVSEGKYAFLENNVIYEYVGDKPVKYTDERTVTAIYYKDGKLCYGNESGVYNYETNEPVEISLPTSFDIGNYHYYVNSATQTVCVLNTSAAEGEEAVTALAEYTLLKEYGNKAYAVKDSDLYEIKGVIPEKLTLTYLDYSDTERILRGDSAEILKTSSAKPQFVALTNGAFMTEVEIDDRESDFFKTGDTVKAGKDVSATSALLLAKTGDNDEIALVMIASETDGESTCYLMNSANVRLLNREPITHIPDDKTAVATVTIASGYVYAAPYVCASTHIAGETEITIQSGDKLEVLGEVTKEDNPELVRSFYKVRLEGEDKTEYVGYVPTGYVSHYTFIEKDPIETPDPDYTEENMIRQVVLVIVVVILVLAAAVYMVYTSTSGKKKNKKKIKKDKSGADDDK